jgi:hypothetical protein
VIGEWEEEWADWVMSAIENLDSTVMLARTDRARILMITPGGSHIAITIEDVTE